MSTAEEASKADIQRGELESEIGQVVARLDRLVARGLVEGFGSARQGDQLVFHIAVATQTNPHAPSFDPMKLEAIRVEIKEAVQTFPFSILGEYQSIMPPAVEKHAGGASAAGSLGTVGQHAPAATEAVTPAPPADERGQQFKTLTSKNDEITSRLADLDQRIQAIFEASEASQSKLQALNNHIGRLDKSVSQLPSRAFVSASAIANLMLVAFSILLVYKLFSLELEYELLSFLRELKTLLERVR